MFAPLALRWSERAVKRKALATARRQQRSLAPLDHHGRERPAIGCPGIEVQPVAVMGRHVDGGMAVDNERAEAGGCA